ncbi:glycoside hydrolase family 1 protein [Spiroplasma alleghenense]|uniref:6-phospho-beta-glucosidase n=1 Tax=Spiroplasma alleghenense TaxID=216931 RepID=A0A345Z4Y0_9MOLU|nr:glycoside hydrolase family 1 protein [Spiroplasma alleghenense]AXK51659.1 6-phospho-beta-glucosidase [Spiroplasma alleghenense]
MSKHLPKEFLIGGSTSGPQTEGIAEKPNQNIFDYWYQQDQKPFHNQVGPNITSDFYHHYKNDIELLSEVGIQIYRTTVQWSRLIKDMKTFEVNQEAVKFYRDYFSRLKKKNIKVILNLFHFDIPIYWHKLGGWENKEFTDAFGQYAKICFQEFGDLIDNWATMNEPIVVSESFYIHDFWWPGLNDFKKGVQVSYHQILASAKAVREFRGLFKNNPDKKISIILNLTPAIPKDDKPENVAAANISNIYSNYSFLDAAVKGTFSKELVEVLKSLNVLPEFDTKQLKIIKENTVDFIGVNYYAPRRVQKPKPKNSKANNLSRYFEAYSDPNAKMNIYRGWEIYPDAIKEIAKTIKEKYNNISWFLSENGMGVSDEERFLKDGVIQDDYRIEFIQDHLKVLAETIEDGANCFAYCVWTPIDCWSWANAYKNRYGLISVDLKTQKRTIKKSGRYFKRVSDTKEI